MKRMCMISVDGEMFLVPTGERLLDAALRSGMNLPHDCRAGICGTCILRLDSGKVLGGDAGRHGYVRTCQAHVLTDLEMSADDVTEALSFRGYVSSIKHLSRDVIKVAVVSSADATHRPGQYFNLAFDGLPQRSFSPSAPLEEDGDEDDKMLRFHIRQFPDGAVSSKFGTRIRLGSPVALEGPFGTACLESGLTNRLVLVSGGTGFAPIWSIASAALAETPARSVVMIVGARQAHDLYMARALQRLARRKNVALTVTVDEGPAPHQDIRTGRPTGYLPSLRFDDIVHVAGPPPLVDAVTAMAQEAGCRVHADAFVPASEPARAKSFLRLFRRAA